MSNTSELVSLPPVEAKKSTNYEAYRKYSTGSGGGGGAGAGNSTSMSGINISMGRIGGKRVFLYQALFLNMPIHYDCKTILIL